MSKQLKLFKNLFANCIIAVVVLSLAIFGVSATAIVASKEDAPIYKGSSATNVSLMINVYWGTEFIEPMLQIFKKHDIKTTFFIGGVWANQNGEVLKKMYEDGHEIGNHGYYHKDHKNISAVRNREEIDITHKLVKNILNYDMNLFAPPSGSFSKETLSEAKSLGYATIMWSRDTIDWRDKNSSLIFSRATKNIKGGELVLMHPTEKTLQALEDIIVAISAAGLKITPVSNVINNN